jgi:hypothetical protein
MVKRKDVSNTYETGYEAGPLLERRIWPVLFFVVWGTLTVIACALLALVAWG